MARTSPKSDLVSGMGAGFEFVKVISDAVKERGGGDSDLRRVMADPRLADQIAEVIMAGNTVFSSRTLAAKLIPDGWVVVEDVQPTEFQISSLRLVPFLKYFNRNGCIDGNKLRQHSVRSKANKGLADAKRMLDNQAHIPVEFRAHYLVFTGTVLRSPDGNLNIPCLEWFNGRWNLVFRWLGLDWPGIFRLVCY